MWMTVLTVVGILFDKLIAGGVLPNEGWVLIVSTVIGAIVKRGWVEASVAKSNAMASVVANPPQPPQG
jgi:hypothetical protein